MKRALDAMATGKSPGLDGLPAEFYQRFWSLLGTDFVDVINFAYNHGQLSPSQRSRVITLIHKRGDRLDMKNWRFLHEELCAEYKIVAIKLLPVVYRPPTTSKHLHNNFNELLNSMLSNASEENKEIIVLGDLNTNFLVPSDNKDLKSIFDIFGFKQMVNKPTRITTTTATLTDVILTNNPASISKSDVVPTCIGDLTCLDAYGK
jgi:hypothetical protein